MGSRSSPRDVVARRRAASRGPPKSRATTTTELTPSTSPLLKPRPVSTTASLSPPPTLVNVTPPQTPRQGAETPSTTSTSSTSNTRRETIKCGRLRVFMSDAGDSSSAIPPPSAWNAPWRRYNVALYASCHITLTPTPSTNLLSRSRSRSASRQRNQSPLRSSVPVSASTHKLVGVDTTVHENALALITSDGSTIHVRHRLKSKVEGWRLAVERSLAEDDADFWEKRARRVEVENARLVGVVDGLERERGRSGSRQEHQDTKDNISPPKFAERGDERDNESESVQELKSENERLRKEVQDLNFSIRRMFSMEEVQEKIEEACQEREAEVLERLQGSGAAVSSNNDLRAMYAELAKEFETYQAMTKITVDNLHDRVREEEVSKMILMQQMESLRMEYEPAIGEYKTLLLRHEELWKKYTDLQRNFYVLQAAHDKEAMAHKRLSKVIRDQIIPPVTHSNFDTGFQSHLQTNYWSTPSMPMSPHFESTAALAVRPPSVSLASNLSPPPSTVLVPASLADSVDGSPPAPMTMAPMQHPHPSEPPKPQSSTPSSPESLYRQTQPNMAPMQYLQPSHLHLQRPQSSLADVNTTNPVSGTTTTYASDVLSSSRNNSTFEDEYEDASSLSSSVVVVSGRREDTPSGVRTDRPDESSWSSRRDGNAWGVL